MIMIKHGGFDGIIGLARTDITPPPGIFCRNWGAARHDAAEGVHRPLTLGALTLQEDTDAPSLVLVDADLGWFADADYERHFRSRLLRELDLPVESLIFTLSHTHSAPPLCDPEPQWQGGELLPAYVESVFEAAVRTTRAALLSARPAVLEWHTGRCDLAANRDLPEGGRILCGHNPQGVTDDVLLVGRVSDESGAILGTLVYYACHPTTLGWGTGWSRPTMSAPCVKLSRKPPAARPSSSCRAPRGTRPALPVCRRPGRGRCPWAGVRPRCAGCSRGHAAAPTGARL